MASDSVYWFSQKDSGYRFMLSFQNDLLFFTPSCLARTAIVSFYKDVFKSIKNIVKLHSNVHKCDSSRLKKSYELTKQSYFYVLRQQQLFSSRKKNDPDKSYLITSFIGFRKTDQQKRKLDSRILEREIKVRPKS